LKKMLVTGGAGFIGSNFIHHMMNQDMEVEMINLDALTYAGNLNNLADLGENDPYSLYIGDITDEELVSHIFEKHQIQWVINFAAETHVDRSLRYPGLFIKTNVLGTQVLLEAAKKYWTIGKDQFGYPIYREDVRFIQVSTDEVYGALGKTGYFREDTPLNPTSPYSASKAAADLLTIAYFKTYKLPVNITRCSNNYGPYQFPEKLIPLMINHLLTGKPLPVYGDGLQVRDWLHVDDHCSAIETVLRKGIPGEVYNVGANNERANIDIVKLMIQITGKPDARIAHIEDRLGHDRRYAVDTTKIASELGWKPKYDFDQGIRKTVEWYQKNEKWLDEIAKGTFRKPGLGITNFSVEEGSYV
jgi:dTDP-glucose 4,6-dehydratase